MGRVGSVVEESLCYGRTLDVEIKSFSLNHNDAWVEWGSNIRWRFTGIYGHPEEENKHKTGRILENLYNNHSGPWICGGDLNLMLTSDEKKGGREFNLMEAEILRNVVNVCELEDLGYLGHPFTWTNNRGGEQNVQEWLDSFLANKEWRQLKGVGKAKKKKFKKRFKFEEMWLREEMCADIMGNAWSRREWMSLNIEKIYTGDSAAGKIGFVKETKTQKKIHQKASQRRARNEIRMIKDAVGNCYKDESQISEVLAKHFEDLFTSGGQREA
uniref:Endonuclease/exonuclease/phosphatase domain-containing protein n=1 Tax=Chenopodium quinoa TaxID=63459 RepID=A0A803L1E6_CHEQI